MRSGVCKPWMHSSMRLINTAPASEHADELVVIDMIHTYTVTADVFQNWSAVLQVANSNGDTFLKVPIEKP